VFKNPILQPCSEFNPYR